MKTLKTLSICATLGILFTASCMAEDQAPTAGDLMKKVLKSEGYSFEQEDGYIVFKHQGLKYIVMKSDQKYVLQILSLIKTGITDENKNLVLANDLNNRFKLHKFASWGKGSIAITYEAIMPNRLSVNDFNLIMNLLQNTTKEAMKQANSVAKE